MTGQGTAYRIPFNRPSPPGRELELMARAVRNLHISGDGQFTREASRMLEEIIGARKVLLTTSCTHALEMAAILVDLREGDEVIVPSFTFVSGVNAFVLRGARPVFCDIRPDTLNLDERLLESLITPRTRVIAPVHYAGVGCEMEAIMDVADRQGITVVEDNAHGLFGTWRGRPLGSIAPLATQSFHETKNITCGEGGALVVNDPRLIDRAEIIREKGTNRSRFFRGQVDKYTWVDIGSSYLPSDLLAAFLVAQLEEAESIQRSRHRVWSAYAERLAEWAAGEGVSLPHVPSDCGHPAHIFHLMLPDLAARQSLIEHLRRHSIHAVFHYLPLNASEMGERFGARRGDCPVAEDVSDRLLRLPLYASLEESEVDEIVAAVTSWRR